MFGKNIYMGGQLAELIEMGTSGIVLHLLKFVKLSVFLPLLIYSRTKPLSVT